MLTSAARRGLATALLTLPLAAFAGTASATSGGGSWPWPLAGELATPYENGADPYAAGQHRGLDIAAPAGTPVRASVGGRVSFAGTLPDGGLAVTVWSDQHLVSYLHLATRAAGRGDELARGELVGTVGTTGKRSIARPHLHFSVRLAAGGAYVDPMTLLGPAGLVAAPSPEAPSAARQPAAAPGAAAPRAVREIPRRHAAIEPAGVRRRNSVHAQQTGDRTAASATRQTRTHTGSVAASARESHAPERAGRVAPPPLRMPSAQAAPASRVERPVASAPTAGGDTAPLPRLALLAAAASFGAALFLRRRPAAPSIPSQPAPPATASEPAPARLRSVS